MQTSHTPWTDMLKKEAKGLSNYSLGEVHEVGNSYVVTQKGTITKSHYYIPKYLVRGFDGKTLWFNVSESQAETEFKRDMPPGMDEYTKYRTSSTSPTDVEAWVPSVP
jgi:hypothetical protein